MKKNRIVIVILSLMLLLVVLYNLNKPITILHNDEIVSQITLYDMESKGSVDIVDKDKIETYTDKLKNLQLKRGKLVGNFVAEELMIMLYDEDGKAIEAFYTSGEDLIYHHWLVEVIDGPNLYQEMIGELEQ